MGLLDNLFKPKPDSDGEKIVENSGAPDPGESHTPAAHAADAPAAKASPFLAPKMYVPRSSVQIVPPTRSQLPPGRKITLAPVAPAIPKEIVLTLGDVLPRIPTHFLRQGTPDPQRELRFSADGLAADIARGRASVFLADIVAQCPDIFLPEADGFDDTQIRLPLQKLVEQIGLAPASRPASFQPPPAPATEPAWAKPAAEPSAPPPAFDISAASPGEQQIHLSLAAILKRCPKEIIIQPLPPIDESVRIAFPFPPIERQLATGQVEVSSLRFIAALPLNLMRCFEAKAGIKVPLPLEEIFQNLPDQAPPATRFHAPPPEPGSSSESRDVALQNAKLAEAILLEPMLPPMQDTAAIQEPKAPPQEPPAAASVENIINANFAAAPAIEPEFHAVPIIVPPAISAPEIRIEPAKSEAPAAPEPKAEEPAVAERKAEESLIEAAPVEEPKIAREPTVEKVAASVPPILAEPVAAPVEAPAFRRFVPSLPPPVLLKPNTEFIEPRPAPVTRSQPEPPPAASADPAPAPAVSTPEILKPPQAFQPPPEAVPPAPEPTAPAPLPPAASALQEPPAEPVPVAPTSESNDPAWELPANGVCIAPPQFRPVVVLPPIVVGAADAPPFVPQSAEPIAQSVISEPVAIQESAPVAEILPVETQRPVPAAVPAATDAATPAPTPLPPVTIAEPAVPLVLDGHIPALFASDAPLALPRIGRLLAALPGIQGCLLTLRTSEAQGGELPAGLDAPALRELSRRMHTALADRTETFTPGDVQHVTLHAEHYSLTLFTRGEACVCAVHRARIFLPGVRERFAAVAEELARAL